LVRDNPNKTELQVSHTVVVPLAEHDLVSRQAQSAIIGCWEHQQINRSAKKSATPIMPRRNNFQRDNSVSRRPSSQLSKAYNRGEAGRLRGQVHVAMMTSGIASAIHDRPHQMLL
jgi:hypothetical protein